MTDKRPLRDAAALADWWRGGPWPSVGWLTHAEAALAPGWVASRTHGGSVVSATAWAESVVATWVAAGVYGAPTRATAARDADGGDASPASGDEGVPGGTPGAVDAGRGHGDGVGDDALAEAESHGGVRPATSRATAADGHGAAKGAWSQDGVGDVLQWADALARLPDVVALIERLGRRRGDRGPPPEGGREVVGVGLGRHVGHATPGALAKLGDPDFDAVFWQQLAEGRLLSWSRGGDGEGGTEGSVERGPALLALDTSASMAGPRGLVARAATLAVARALRAEGRAVRLVAFGAEGESQALPLDDDPASWVRLLAWGFQGGTDLDGPVVRALAEHAAQDGGDLVLLTDGEASLDPRTVAAAEAAHRSHGWSLELVLVGDAHLAIRSVLEAGLSVC